ncbi:MAG: efflux RND transporter periplasmic adaptor subunit [Vitreoscilla sp.]
MTTASPAIPDGAAMDRALPSRRRPWLAPALVAAAVAGAALLAWQRTPRVPTVGSPQMATVRAGVFHDEVALRARVEPLRSVQLDAAEAGRVEEVLAHDGDHVAAGAPLYRLQSAEQEQLLMQRGSEVAQQMVNVSVQRTAQVASLAQNRRELAQLQAAQQQAQSDWRRQARLAADGFVSAAAVEQSLRTRELADRMLRQAEADQRAEAAIREQSIAEMARAVQGLQRGLQLLERARDRLLQRAAMAGQLSGFQLQVGASVRPGDRLGRIDDPDGGVELVADVDEFWLPRLQAGQSVASDVGDLRLAQALPQVQGGKVRVLLRWPDARSPASLRPGQAVDVRIQLSPPKPALLLPDGPGVQAKLYVRDGNQLQRRSVAIGRRASGLVEILAGLNPGDDVLISQPPADSERLALP